ncbi:hypothetical protein D918_01568 [Trichuris suis]|nr:hypothetical protein D918_01568 [Trichuris suis]
METILEEGTGLERRNNSHMLQQAEFHAAAFVRFLWSSVLLCEEIMGWVERSAKRRLPALKFVVVWWKLSDRNKCLLSYVENLSSLVLTLNGV